MTEVGDTAGVPELSDAPRGIVLTVHAQPGARRSRVVGRHGDACKIAVTAPPVDGKANDEVVRVVADLFAVAARDVTVVAGRTSRRKRVAVTGIDLASASARLVAVYQG